MWNITIDKYVNLSMNKDLNGYVRMTECEIADLQEMMNKFSNDRRNRNNKRTEKKSNIFARFWKRLFG